MKYEPRGEALVLQERSRGPEPAIRYEMARSFTLRDFVEVIRTRFHWLLAAVLIGAFLGGSYAVFRDRTYEASTEVYIDPRGLEIVDRNVTRQSESSDASIAWIESQMRIMTSTEMLNQVIETQDLRSDPEFSSNPPQFLDPIFEVFGVEAADELPPPDVLGRVSRAVSTYRPQRSYVVEIHVRTGSPEKSVRLADAVATAYLASAGTNQSQLARRASLSLSDRAEELREAVTEAENRIEAFRARNSLAGANGALVSEETLGQTNQALTEASRQLSAARARRDQVASVADSGAGSIPEAVNSPAMAQLRARYQAAVEERGALAADLLPRHPRMRIADEQVAEARKAIDAELSRIAEAAEADYQRAAAVHADTQARLAELEAKSFQTNQALVDLRELQRDLEAKRSVYTSYLQRATELAGQEQLDLSDSRIISYARPPREPVGPSSALIVAVATTAGLFIGLTLILIASAVAGPYRSGR